MSIVRFYWTCSIPLWGLAFGLHARRTRTGRRRRSAGTNSPVDCWLARGRVPGECGGQQGLTGGSLTESVGLLFCCYSPGRRVGSDGDLNSCGGGGRRRSVPAGTQAFRQNCPHRKRSPARRGCVSFFCPAGGREGRAEGGKASFVGRIAQEHAWKTGNSNIKAGICDKKTKRKVGTENLPGPGIYGRIKSTKRTPSGPHNEKKRRR